MSTNYSQIIEKINRYIRENQNQEITGEALNYVLKLLAGYLNNGSSDNNKLDKPTEEGTTEDYPFVVGVNEDNESVKLPAGDLGKNFANTDLTVTENRKHSGSNTVEFGMPLVFSNVNQQFKNLPDKSFDAIYNELVGKDSNGNIAKVGINALTKTMQNANDNDKDAWRKAQLKTTESYSTGQPRIDVVIPPVVNNTLDYIQYISLIGLNLFIDNVTPTANVWMVHKETNTRYDIDNYEVTQTNPSILSFGLNFKNYPKGAYEFYVIHNGITSINPNELLLTDVIEYIDYGALSFEKLDEVIGTVPEEEKDKNYYPSTTGFSIQSKRISDGNYLNRYVKSSPIIKKEYLKDNGLCLVFSYESNQKYGVSPIFNLGFTNSNNNLVQSTPIIYGFEKEYYTIKYTPSGKSYDSDGILKDLMYVIIKNGKVKTFFPTKGFVDVTFLEVDSDLSLVLKLPHNNNGFGGGSETTVSINLNKIYKI